jgi:hypothetical protein
MRSLISSLTIFAVLMHALLGCHAHHAHAAEAAHPAEAALVTAHCCSHSHDQQPSESHEEPCDEEQCDLGDATPAFRKLDNTVAFSHWAYLVTPDSVGCSSDVSRTSTVTDHLSPGCPRTILYCVLRN